MKKAKSTITQKSAIILEVEAGEYWWCACEDSKNQPHCDGSHTGTEFSPVNVKIDKKKKSLGVVIN